MLRKITALGVALAVTSIGSVALAEEAPRGAAAAPAAAPAEEASGGEKKGGLSVGALVGYGLHSVDVGTESINFYGLGFGARAGYTLPAGLYIGGQFIYHTGGEIDAGFIKVTNKIMFVGGEVGYEIPAGGLVIRPSVGAGMAAFTAKSEVTFFGTTVETDASESKLYLSPGATLLIPLGSTLFAGADLRYHMPLDVTDGSAPAIYGTVGANF